MGRGTFIIIGYFFSELLTVWKFNPIKILLSSPVKFVPESVLWISTFPGISARFWEVVCIDLKRVIGQCLDDFRKYEDLVVMNWQNPHTSISYGFPDNAGFCRANTWSHMKIIWKELGKYSETHTSMIEYYLLKRLERVRLNCHWIDDNHSWVKKYPMEKTSLEMNGTQRKWSPHTYVKLWPIHNLSFLQRKREGLFLFDQQKTRDSYQEHMVTENRNAANILMCGKHNLRYISGLLMVSQETLH